MKKRRPISQYYEFDHSTHPHSDIIGRIEVPPPSSKYRTMLKDAGLSPILVPSTANSHQLGEDYMNRRSIYTKSCSNLVDTVSHSHTRYPLSAQHEQLPVPLHHRSLHSLAHQRRLAMSKPSLHQNDENQCGRDSPLSAAFRRAKEKMTKSSANLTEKPHALEGLQLLLLLISPQKRRKLQLLLRFMSKVLCNSFLETLDSNLSIRMLLLEKFCKWVLAKCPK